MKSFTVNKNDSGQRLDKFITKSVPALPKSLMYKYIRLKRIKVNGKKSDISYKLNENDLIELYISDEFFTPPVLKYDFLSASTKLTIIYEDENIILCDKPVGLLSHPDENEYNDTLITRIKRYLYEKGEFLPDDENSFAPALVNRIDRNTGGIVIAAKNSQSLRVLNEKLKLRQIDKYYLCVINGVLKNKSDTLVSWMTKDSDKNQVKVYNHEIQGAKTMKTQYKVLAENRDYSLLEVKLLTGRTHQIRAQFASIGHPLVGDGKYGKNSQNKKAGYFKQLLYSYKIVFNFTDDAENLNYLSGKSFEVENVPFKEMFEIGKFC